ncbi:MAG: cyclic nucleotide-binding domain-containing protein [Gammaproteobacteria bacterium]|nr:cyclic nucleotide-binding domain-containing protein [Gammaproteobacteria bacterium]
MPIKIMLARSPREIDDALWLRHEVFVIEDGKFGGQALHGERLVDKFDAFPSVYHVVAYEDEHPVATMRLVRDSPVGLPVDELYDFTEFRARARDDLPALGPDWENRDAAVFGSAGMLAIRKPWRRRRDVIRAMFRMAATVCQSYGASHVVVVVNHETAGMYRRFGFVTLAEKIWVEEIGNHVIPLAGISKEFLSWALGSVVEFALADFQDSFERLVLRKDELVFAEGERGEHAYVVQTGEVRITRQTPDGRELTLANLGPGALFGELALIDDQSRAASAVALSDVELMTLDRASFQSQLQAHPERSRALFKVFARRMRSMDELAMVLAFARPDERLDFALDAARSGANPDPKQPLIRVFRGGPRELALMGAVAEELALARLELAAAQGQLEFSDRHISFHPR